MLNKSLTVCTGLLVAFVGCSSPTETPSYSQTTATTAGVTSGTTGTPTTTGASSTTGGVTATTTGTTGGVVTSTATTAGVTSTTAGVTSTTTGAAATTTAGVTSTTTGATVTTATTAGVTTTTTGTTATTATSTTGGSTTCSGPITPNGADSKFSFFVTSYKQIVDLSGSNDGFGGDLRYNNAATGLQGADAICQEMACRVGFGNRTWKAFLSTSAEDARDRIGTGPWYDFAGNLVANDLAGLFSGDRQSGGCCDEGTYDELGLFHNGQTDQNQDGIEDDDHDTMTASNEDGTYAGFSCEDWTSTTLVAEGGGGMGLGGGIVMGHSWPAMSGTHWVNSHAGHSCAAGTNFIQDGPGDSATVGGGGGYGGFYCFALP